MKLDFNVTSAPPDSESIEAARANQNTERQRLRGLDKRFLTVAVAIVASMMCFVFFVIIPIVTDPGSTEGGIIFILVYSMPYLFFAVFAIGNTLHHHKVEVPRKALKIAEEALQEAEHEDIAALRDACQEHAPLDAYHSQVQSQGRSLFKGELEAMRRWLEEKDGPSTVGS